MASAASTLAIQSFQGAPDGMNLSLPPDEILETQARYIQDALVDKPGLIRRRGPVKNASGVAALTRQAWGIVATTDPAGNARYAVLNGSGANAKISFLAAGNATISAELTWPGNYALYPYVDVTPFLTGGTLISTTDKYGQGAAASVILWYGANLANYSTGTLTCAVGSTAVTGTSTVWSTNIVPGMFLLVGNDLVGCVEKVNSNTSITLTAPAIFAHTGSAYTATSIRALGTKVMKGTITASATHPHIHGGNTKWTTQLAAGMAVYRLRDMGYIGTVTSVQSDFAATLTADARFDCSDDPYVAIAAQNYSTASATVTASDPGFLSAVYANRQWYANNPNLASTPISAQQSSRVWFSDTTDPEGLDLTADGDWFDVYGENPQSQPIKAITSTLSSLLVLKERETWAVFGQSEETFTPKMLESDGCIDGATVQPFAGGAIWAGRTGILFFDGSRVQNLTQNNLGKAYHDIIKTFDNTTYHAWSMLARGHYFLFIENCTGPYTLDKGGTTSTPTRLTIAYNLLSGSITFLTNVDIRGATQLPTTIAPTVWYIVNDASIGHICSADDLFDTTGVVDSITCTGNTAGPDFYWEGKAHNAGDGARLKKWRWFEPNAVVTGDVLKVDAVKGLSSVDSALTDTIPIGTIFQVGNRIFVDWDSQYIAFRVWQNSSAVTDVQIGPYDVAFKFLRIGRPG